MLTIENQLKQLQQSITTTSSISSSTAEQQEVILVREAEPSSQWVLNTYLHISWKWITAVLCTLYLLAIHQLLSTFILIYRTLCNSNSANHASSIDSENSSKTDQENLNNSKDWVCHYTIMIYYTERKKIRKKNQIISSIESGCIHPNIRLWQNLNLKKLKLLKIIFQHPLYYIHLIWSNISKTLY